MASCTVKLQFKLVYKSNRKDHDAAALTRLSAVDKKVLLNFATKAICQSVSESFEEAPVIECVLLAQNCDISNDEFGTNLGPDLSRL